MAASVIMWTACGVAATALLLWSLDAIKPPAAVLAGAASVMVLLVAARRKNRAS